MKVQALVAQGPVKCLDIGVIYRFPRPTKVDPDVMVISPQVDQPTGKFRAIISKKISRSPAMSHQAVEDIDDMLAAKTLSNLDRQRFAAEHIDHRQHPELLSIAELIMHKVEAPRLVRPTWFAARLPVYDHLAPTRLLRT